MVVGSPATSLALSKEAEDHLGGKEDIKLSKNFLLNSIVYSGDR
ncbi:hypothetical protein KDK_18360 [Dictyobacter kobayashii]|uniref:Uncharacterized protein n=1 Tax=Dictyobacter kobayashii TaxID=2014872 RepID=A0A402AG20_9CHLR|nr:hypothetical protein KDK_18360 [Dictyobacter kobayashii]